MLTFLFIFEFPELFIFYNQYIYLYYFIFKCFFILFLMIHASNPLTSILYFILFFFINFGLIFLIGLDFFSLISLLVYIGAISVLFIFVIMLLDVRFALTYEAKQNTFYFLLFFMLFIFIFFASLASYNNIILEPINYQNWINVFYHKPLPENLGFFITNVYYIHIFLIGLLLTLVLVILLSFILIEKFNLYNKNFFKNENIQYKRLLIF